MRISRTLASSPRPPEGTQSEPAKGERETNGNRQTTAASARSMIFFILFEGGTGKTEGHQEENQAHHLEPELVRRASERATGGAHTAHHRVERTASSGLLPGDPCYHAELSECRNLAHGLDFNSLRRYNDATPGDGDPANRSAFGGI